LKNKAVRKAYVDGSLGQIHYLYNENQESSKTPLVCLHQSPKSAFEFTNVLAEMGKDRSVFAFDYPGYGMSDAAASEDDTTIGMYARELHIALDALDLDKVDLLGNHTGSKVAIEMACQKPECINIIAMISAAIFTPEELRKFKAFFRPIPLDDTHTRIDVMWQRILERRIDGISLEWLDRSLFQNLMAGEAYEWGHSAAFAYAEKYKQGLKNLPHRKVIFNPNDDLQTCTRRADKMLHNGKVIELPEWSYGFMDLHTEAFIKLLRPCLDSY